MVNTFVPGMVGYQNGWLRLTNCGGLLVALIGCLVPWRRLPPRATLAFVPAALALVGGAVLSGGMPPQVYGVWYLVLYAWVGMWHPPRTCLLLSPFIAMAYVAPLALQSDRLAGDIASVGIAIPAGVMLGEVLAKTVEALRRSQQDQEEVSRLLAKASVTDDLTGVGNRRHGNQLLDGLAPGDAVVLLDLDHFKGVNDEYGHARGDQVLRELGEFLADAVRGGDDVARFGGEEFLVVLRGAAADAGPAVERLVEAWRRRQPVVTFSAGVALHQAGVAPSTTLSESDRALYEAKRQGRDRLCLAPLGRG